MSEFKMKNGLMTLVFLSKYNARLGYPMHYQLLCNKSPKPQWLIAQFLPQLLWVRSLPAELTSGSLTGCSRTVSPFQAQSHGSWSPCHRQLTSPRPRESRTGLPRGSELVRVAPVLEGSGTPKGRWARLPPSLEKKACVPQEPLRSSNRDDTFPDLV